MSIESYGFQRLSAPKLVQLRHILVWKSLSVPQPSSLVFSWPSGFSWYPWTNRLDMSMITDKAPLIYSVHIRDTFVFYIRAISLKSHYPEYIWHPKVTCYQHSQFRFHTLFVYPTRQELFTLPTHPDLLLGGDFKFDFGTVIWTLVGTLKVDPFVVPLFLVTFAIDR